MKNIEYLEITVTYKVGLSVEVPDKVFNQLYEIFAEGKSIDDTSMGYRDATLWLNDNIKEKDCYDINYEIEEMI